MPDLLNENKKNLLIKEKLHSNFKRNMFLNIYPCNEYKLKASLVFTTKQKKHIYLHFILS